MTPAELERDLRRSRMFAAVAERYGVRIARTLQRRHGKSGEAIERAYAAALGIAGEQATRAHRPVDQITVLQCAPGCQAAKHITPAGTADYACGRWFATTEAAVSGIAELAKLLDELEREPRLFVIRARLIAGRQPGQVRRLLYPDPKTGEAAYFEACGRRWCGLDFDALVLPEGLDPVDLEAVAAVAIARLPDPFRRASCWAQLTGGAGIKPGGRIRLFYWLDRTTTGAELKRWLKSVPGLDTSTLNDVTPNYVARPIFTGVADPVPRRSALFPGELDTVAVPELTEPKRQPAAPWRATARQPMGQGSAERYAAACLRNLALAPEGARHPTCLRVACSLFELARAGVLDRNAIASRIKGVMVGHGFGEPGSAGRDLREIDSILNWAWQHAEARGLSDAR